MSDIESRTWAVSKPFWIDNTLHENIAVVPRDDYDRLAAELEAVRANADDLHERLQVARATLVHLASSDDMTVTMLRGKARRVYAETAPPARAALSAGASQEKT